VAILHQMSCNVHYDASMMSTKTNTGKILITPNLPLLCMMIENGFNHRKIGKNKFDHQLSITIVKDWKVLVTHFSQLVGNQIFIIHLNCFLASIPKNLVVQSKMAIDLMIDKNLVGPQMFWALLGKFGGQLWSPTLATKNGDQSFWSA